MNPQYQSVAISKKKTYNNIRKDIANLAKGCRFPKADTISLLADLNEYTNRSGAFTNGQLKDCAINFWQSLVGANALRVFASKIFSIALHNAVVEQLFSQLSLSKTKICNRMSVERMKMLAIVRSSLNLHSKPNSRSSSSLALEQDSSFNIALQEDEDLNMIPAVELSLEDLDFTCKDNDDFHKDFDSYFDFVRFRQESFPYLNETTIETQTIVIDEEDSNVDDVLV